jgi:hypothetical protein
MLDSDDLLGTLDSVNSVRCSLSNDQALSDTPQRDWPVQTVIDYLDADPRHAIVITAFEDDGEDIKVEPPTYVLRGASERDDNFYIGPFPADDPGNADGGSWTADEALAYALNGL